MGPVLQLIAIKVNKGSVGGRKLSTAEPYYFIDGYCIINDAYDTYIIVEDNRWCETNLYYHCCPLKVVDDYYKV